MTAFISPPPRLQFFTNAGVPMASGLLYTYAAGTTTPLTTYTDSTGLVANTNPVILDSRGEASIWLGGVGYKFKLATPANVDVWTQDNIAPGSSAYMTYTPAGTGAVTTTVQAKLRESVSVKDFGAVGDGVANDTAALQTAMAAASDVSFHVGNYNIPTTPSYSGSQILDVGNGASVTGAGASALGLTAGGLAKRQLVQLNTTGGDTATQFIRRQANHSGGSASWVSAALNVRSDVTNAAAANAEFAVLGAVYNYANAGQNVGGYFQGNKYSTGPTWGSVLEGRDKTGLINPTGALIGVEVDVFANGGDSNNTRVGVEITIGKNTALDTKCEASYGARITSVFGDSTQARVKRAFAVYNLEFDCGFDTSQATQSASGVAFRLADQQKLSFVAANDRYLTFNTNTFQYWAGGASPALSVTDGTGVLNINGSFTILGTQVVTARRVGYSAMTGTANLATVYDTATVTLAQLAGRVMALQASLTTHGLIGP